MVTLHPGERLDDLITNGLKIIQRDDVFSFSLDAVLLARFCTVPARGKIVDLCTGNGVVPLLLSTRTERSTISAVEIQPKLAELAARNVALNQLEHRIEVICGDLKQYHETCGYGAFDLVTVNPPYLPIHTGAHKGNPHISAARHELYCTLSDVAQACSRLVKSGGKVAMVHRPSRLADIVAQFRAAKLEPKRIRFIHPRPDREANIVCIEATKDGKPDVKLLPPLIVYERDGTYAKELADIFAGQLKETYY